MSYYSRLAIATRGFRGGAGQTLYISQEFSVEDSDRVLASVISETVDTATIISSPLSVSIADATPLTVSIVDSPLTVSIDSGEVITVDVQNCS